MWNAEEHLKYPYIPEDFLIKKLKVSYLALEEMKILFS